jgi:hypothetical protein
MYYCVIPGKTIPYIGMARKEPFTSDSPDPMTELGELWFEFGDTRAEAYFKITDEMVKLGLEKQVIFCGGGAGLPFTEEKQL